jgi:hypothetical protein
MRYQIVYLLAGERRMVGLEAADAASALAALPDRPRPRFELLAVLRTDCPTNAPGSRPVRPRDAWRDGDAA